MWNAWVFRLMWSGVLSKSNKARFRQTKNWVVVSQFIDEFASECGATMNVSDNPNECWYGKRGGVGDDDVVIDLAKSLKNLSKHGS